MKNSLANNNPMLLCDFYKISHKELYPQGTEKIYSTFTPRTSRIQGIDKVIVFGIQQFIKKYLIDYFNENFFGKEKTEVINDYQRVIKNTLGIETPDTTHIELLYDLGHLPIKIKMLREGTLVPIRVPCLTIENTDERFFWLTNFLETLMSCEIWQTMTSATIAFEYRKIVQQYSTETCDNNEHLMFQCHDFSMRGMSSVASAINSGIGHLLSFTGTDTIPAILAMEKYYNSDVKNELIGTSIPASEHSISCAYGQNNELEYYRHIIQDVHPNGFVSLVSDTWDLWNVIENYLPKLKGIILNRNGKVVIRPDSGCPVKILCGDNSYPVGTPQHKGVIELLWDIFGGTVNEKGYKVLDSHIGAIYGDSITLERCREILNNLKNKGFASSNVVLGIGSFSYQFVTRDTFGFALKATYAVVDGEERLLFKDPITDDGTKKSQRGIVAVVETDGELKLVDGLNRKNYEAIYKSIDLLETVFVDGKLVRDESLAAIRERVNKYIENEVI